MFKFVVLFSVLSQPVLLIIMECVYNIGLQNILCFETLTLTPGSDVAASEGNISGKDNKPPPQK